jgi:hypothetical protein
MKEETKCYCGHTTYCDCGPEEPKQKNKMKNIHMLPTEKLSRLVIDTIENKLYYQPILHNKTVNVLTQHIYITSDEEIKEGDWRLDIRNGNIYKSNKADSELYDNSFRKKIILTTDQDLIKDGVQAIDDKFLEWFVKNPICEEVKVEKEFIQTPNNLKDGFYYKIIIPKEEPKQERERGITITNVGKQETLEEFAQREASEFHKKGTVDWNKYRHLIEVGAKWQQEQIGKSEFLQKLRATKSDAEARRLILEQFKNK